MSNSAPHEVPEFSLADLLVAHESGSPCTTQDPGDVALLEDRFSDAAVAYAAGNPSTPDAQAKLGYAMALAGEPGSTKFLTLDNVGDHPTAKAVLAWKLLHRSGFGTRKQLRDASADLFQSTIDSERPSPIALYALLESWFSLYLGEGRPLHHAKRADLLYPGQNYFLGVLAREQRIAGALEPGLLTRIAKAVSTTVDATVLNEALEWAFELKTFDVADRALQRIRAEADPADPMAFSVLSAYVDLRRGQAGDKAALERGWHLIETARHQVGPDSTAPFFPHDANVVSASLALEANDPQRVAATAANLVDYVYDCDLRTPAGLHAGMITVAVPALNGCIRLELDPSFWQYTERVRNAAPEEVAVRFALLAALHSVVNGTETEEERSLIRQLGPVHGPLAEFSAIADVLTQAEEPELRGLGILLARLAEHVEERPDQKGLVSILSDSSDYLSDLDIDQLATVFREALSWLQGLGASGEFALQCWGEQLLEANSDLYKRYADHFEQQTGRPAPPPPIIDPLQRELARFAHLSDCPNDPAELSLLQAAALVAVLRGEADHSQWTVAPLASGSGAFEPEVPAGNKRFYQSLFDLASLGAIGFSDRTPTGVLSISEQGRLQAHLDRVVWSITPRTLALMRTIRDLPRNQWPDAWRESAPVLSRDLAAQELLVLMIHLCEERGLSPPPPEDLLPQLRELMEKRSLAHGYYLVTKTVREGLDYKVKFTAGRAHTATRLTTLLRGNIEKSVDQGWDTRYGRNRDIPQSQLSSALHDVLTGWGQKAFDEPVFGLPLE